MLFYTHHKNDLSLLSSFSWLLDLSGPGSFYLVPRPWPLALMFK